MNYASLVSQIGKRLLQLREERQGLQAAEVARALRITPSALSQLERGTTKNPRPENLLAAARFFNVSVAWLINGTGPRLHVEAETESEAQALLMFRKLSASGQGAALAQLEWMAGRDAAPGDSDALPFNPNRRLN